MVEYRNIGIAALGGAAGGWASLYAGAYGGKFVGDFVEGTVAELVYQAANGDFDMNGVVRSGALSMIPGPKIKGITCGRGSFAAVTNQMITKMQRGLIHRITGKTFSKIIAHELVTDAYATMLGGW